MSNVQKFKIKKYLVLSYLEEIPPMADFIPSSVRADGSVRKERRVRPGYVPQDEIPAYVPPARRTTAASSSVAAQNTSISSPSAGGRSLVANRQKSHTSKSSPAPAQIIASPSVSPVKGELSLANASKLDSLRQELAEITRMQESLERRRADVEHQIRSIENNSAKSSSAPDKAGDLVSKPSAPERGPSDRGKEPVSMKSIESNVAVLSNHFGDLDITPPDDS